MTERQANILTFVIAIIVAVAAIVFFTWIGGGVVGEIAMSKTPEQRAEEFANKHPITLQGRMTLKKLIEDAQREARQNPKGLSDAARNLLTAIARGEDVHDKRHATVRKLSQILRGV